MKENFSVRVSIIRNPFSKNDFEESIKLLLLEKKFKKVVIDGKKPKWYERKIKKILRDKMMAVKKLKTVRDESEAGIRLADLLAGLARWHFEDVKRDKIETYKYEL